MLRGKKRQQQKLTVNGNLLVMLFDISGSKPKQSPSGCRRWEIWMHIQFRLISQCLQCGLFIIVTMGMLLLPTSFPRDVGMTVPRACHTPVLTASLSTQSESLPSQMAARLSIHFPCFSYKSSVFPHLCPSCQDASYLWWLISLVLGRNPPKPLAILPFLKFVSSPLLDPPLLYSQPAILPAQSSLLEESPRGRAVGEGEGTRTEGMVRPPYHS